VEVVAADFSTREGSIDPDRLRATEPAISRREDVWLSYVVPVFDAEQPPPLYPVATARLPLEVNSRAPIAGGLYLEP